MSFASLLTIILVIAKLMGYFHHSWLLVFAPVLLTTLVGLLILGGAVLLASISVYLESK